MPFPKPLSRFFRFKKRPLLLLEAMIAFAIVVLCALPLLAPHFAMLRAQQAYREQLALDHAVNLFYGQIVQQLYLNQIPWDDLQKKPLEITPKMLQEVGIIPSAFPYKGFFTFTPTNIKPPQPAKESAFLYSLDFTFTRPKAKPQNYHYEVFIVRKLG